MRRVRRRIRSKEVIGSKKFDKYQMQCVSDVFIDVTFAIMWTNEVIEQTSKKTTNEKDLRKCQSNLIHLPI